MTRPLYVECDRHIVLNFPLFMIFPSLSTVTNDAPRDWLQRNRGSRFFDWRCICVRYDGLGIEANARRGTPSNEPSNSPHSPSASANV